MRLGVVVGWMVVFGLGAASCSVPRGRAAAPAGVTAEERAFNALLRRSVQSLDRLYYRSPTRMTLDELRAYQGHLSQHLARLRATDTTRVGEAQRIDFLLLEASWLAREFETRLVAARRVRSDYYRLDRLRQHLHEASEPTYAQWSWALQVLRDARDALEFSHAQLGQAPALPFGMPSDMAERLRVFLEDEIAAFAAGAAAGMQRDILRVASEAAVALQQNVLMVGGTPWDGRETWAIGRQAYDWFLQVRHLLNYDADSLIVLGEIWFACTLRELDAFAEEVWPGRHWRELADSLRGNHPRRDGIVAAYEQATERARAHVMKEGLVRVPPRAPLAVVGYVPRTRTDPPLAAYSPITGTSIGRFYVSVVSSDTSQEEAESRLRAHAYGWIPVVTAHETYPGHHLQRVRQRENRRPARRMISNPYFVEGWASYAEELMERSGFFDTEERFSQLQMRLWRSARAVLDPALHIGRITPEQAVAFLINDVGLEPAVAEAEVQRYLLIPGYAPGHLVGGLEIERMRQELVGSFEPSFDEREFHERLLDVGPMPLPLVRRALREWYPELAPGQPQADAGCPPSH